jgi:hypothetical protein
MRADISGTTGDEKGFHGGKLYFDKFTIFITFRNET